MFNIFHASKQPAPFNDVDVVPGEMLKFLSICAAVALGVVSVLGLPMDMEAGTTTTRPEATTEDTTGRLLTLPDPEKCANRK